MLDYELLLCPHCQGDYVHLDDVFILGRQHEDGPIIPVHVAATGEVDDATTQFAEDGGRRHSFLLAGYCELCDAKVTVEFRQHKGQTLVMTTGTVAPST